MRVAAWVALGVLAAGGALAQKPGPAGTWLSQSGDTRVRVAPCGQAMCGTIVWVKNPGKDTQNPNASYRGRDVVGIQMITMYPNGESQWKGSLYRYTDGQTFNGTMKLSGPNSMELSGCASGSIICRAQTWSRVN